MLSILDQIMTLDERLAVYEETIADLKSQKKKVNAARKNLLTLLSEGEKEEYKVRKGEPVNVEPASHYSLFYSKKGGAE